MAQLTFSRSKFVGIECPAQDTFLAHGVLEDHIYGLELGIEVKVPDFEITRIEGRWKRYTTLECPKAIPKLQNAVGLRILDQDFRSKVRRIIWREGCEHFANLLLECCDAIKWAAFYEEWQELEKKEATPDKKEYLGKKLEGIPDLRDSCMLLSGDRAQR